MTLGSPRFAVCERIAGVLALILAAAVLTACGAIEQSATPVVNSSATHIVTATAATTGRTLNDAPEQPSRSSITIDDGFIPDGESISPFDTAHPAIENLSTALREAIQQAASDAVSDGVELVITSAWRSAAYQQSLLSEAIALYGSVDEARKWVNTPERSTHVTGDAVDTGPWDANEWLSQYGYRYGLCQTYANEPWHFELTVTPGESCPEPLVDASVG